MAAHTILVRAPLRGHGVIHHIAHRLQSPHTTPSTPHCAQPTLPSEWTMVAAWRSSRARYSALQRATWADGQGEASMYTCWERAAADPCR